MGAGLADEIDVHCEGDLARITVRGTVTLTDLKSALELLVASPGYRPRIAMLWDLRAADAGELRAPDLTRYARHLADYPERFGARVAMVVSRDLEFGVMRMWQSFAEAPVPQERRVFRNLDEALGWLRETDG